MTPYLPGADRVPAELANDFKPLPDINVVRHGGRYLALAEVDPPVEITADLDTVGRYDFGGVIPGMCAHPRIDPVSGEMVLFRYNIEAPFLTWSVVAPDGSVKTPPQIVDVDGSFMVHDFVITSSFVVLFVGPLAFDFDTMLSGGNPLTWKPELGMRIAVIRRDAPSAEVTWIETDAFWVWHFANAFERTTDAGRVEIAVDHTQWTRPALSGSGPIAGAISRSVLDVAEASYRNETFDDQSAEFARIDNRLIGQQHRYFVVANKTGDLPPGEQNTLVRIDTEKATIERWVSGDAVFDEVIFVPAPDGGLEEGYYATFRTDRRTLESDFVLLAAEDISAGPVVRIPLPHRVPGGLHGNWFETEPERAHGRLMRTKGETYE
jgi:carotenoid cleavage dioxygenase-like enzyme